MQINIRQYMSEDFYCESDDEDLETNCEFGLDDMTDDEFPDSAYWTATHNYECRVFNEMDRKISVRAYGR